MRILLVHNYYRQPGGEDTVFEADKSLLERFGHNVGTYVEHSGAIEASSVAQKASLSLQAVWSLKSYRRMIRAMERHRPEVVHFHNTFPLISPSAYYACRSRSIAVVQTIHNYRLLCTNGLLFRNGRVCVDCLGKWFTWRGIAHACYHDSRTESAVVTAMLGLHKLFRTWHTLVDRYIALTEFAKTKLIEGGLPALKIVVKPNFLEPPMIRQENSGNFALFAGRLSPEKGVSTMLRAWRRLLHVKLKIVGGGPLIEQVRSEAATHLGISAEVLGPLPHPEVLRLLAQARLLVFPSEGLETFGMILLESMAYGIPVVASRVAAIPELIKDGFSGLIFDPADERDLELKVRWAWEHPEAMAAMGRNALDEYERRYTPEPNHEMLMEIYKNAISHATRPPGA